MSAPSLLLHEEILLLALKDREGSYHTAWVDMALGAALLAELIIGGHVWIEQVSNKKSIMRTVNEHPPEHPLLAECHVMLAQSRKDRSATHWVSKFSGLKDLRHRTAAALVDHRILRADEKTILLIFKKKVYPEIDHAPEAELLSRLQQAIESTGDVDARTAVLVALAHQTDILVRVLGKSYTRKYKERLATIGKGDVVIKGAKEAIEAIQAVFIMTAVLPVIVTPSS